APADACVSPVLYVSIRTDALGRPHAYILNRPDRDLESDIDAYNTFYANLKNEGLRGIFMDEFAHALIALGEMYGNLNLIYVVPTDNEGDHFCGALLEALLRTDAYVLGPLRNVSTTGGEFNLRFTEAAANRSR